ncbi:MAG: AraC family transcriptional regulator [Nitratireductor sp.]|nr:AraC family transcriptional regulator [Nitratireductor sp.]
MARKNFIRFASQNSLGLKYLRHALGLGMGLHDTLLGAHRVLHTRDLDEARQAVARRYCDHRLDLVAGNSLEVTHRHARGAHVSLNVLSYGADVAIDPGELKDFYLLQLPLRGSAKISHRGEDVDANPQCGTLLNPDRPTRMLWRGDCLKLMVQIDAAFLTEVAIDACGAALPGPVRFDPKVDLAREAGQRLLTLALAAARVVGDRPGQPGSQGLPQLALERQLAAAMLEAQPSNISHLIDRAARTGICTRSVRRAIAFVQERHHEDICLDDIALAAGLHRRTLQTAFQQHMGVTPMQYLRDVRLDHARFHLLRRHNRASVGEIAYDCGYSHLGRFSRDFRARFGESPREVR